jgi:hypothetical protein
MHCLASVFMCFHYVFTAETCTFGTFYLYTKIHMYHIFYMKCTVLLVLSCVSTVFSLCFHCRNINIWYISHEFTKIHMHHIFYMKCTGLLVFSCSFTVFSLQKHILLVHFTCIYTKIHMYHIFYMKCTALLVFSCVFTVFSLQKHVHLVHFTCLYQNTHEPCILHEIQYFASILMCFQCVFTAETCTFNTFHIYTNIHM